MCRQTWSTRDAAKLTGLTPSALRSLAHDGLLATDLSQPTAPQRHPRARRLRFDFRDLTVGRLAHFLAQSGLDLDAVRHALRVSQKQTRAHEVPLSSARLQAVAGRLVVSDAVGCWEAQSGRDLAERPKGSAPAMPIALPLAETDLAQERVMVRPSPRHMQGNISLEQLPQHGAKSQADDWFNRGLAAEEADPQRAYNCYMRALGCDPEHVEAIINVGRLCSADGDAPRAAAFFRLAVRIDRAHPIALFNLAVTQHDLGLYRQAIATYRQALTFDPQLADAHYNLATLLAKSGDEGAAKRHFSLYQASHSPPA